MVLQGDGVYPAESFLVRAYPDAPLPVLGHRHDGRRKALLHVCNYLVVAAQTVGSVLVGAHPLAVLPVYQGADDAGIANDITAAKVMTHVVETLEIDGLLVDTFLQESEPEVAVVVADDGVDLALCQIHLAAEERIVVQVACTWVIDTDAHAVVANDDESAVVTVERTDGIVPSLVYMYERLAPQAVDATRCGTYVDDAVAVLTERCQSQSGTLGHVAAHAFAVVTHESLPVGGDPQPLLSVFYHEVDGMDVGQLPAYLLGSALISELHHT